MTRNVLNISGPAVALWRGSCMALALGALLSGCVPGPFEPTPEARASTQFRTVDATRRWADVQGGLLTMERNLGTVHEQRVALPNDTRVAGDNYVLLRARKMSILGPGPFDMHRVVRAAGGVPAPFGTLDDTNLHASRDSRGTYLWAKREMGPGVTCVVGLRSLSRATGAVPAGADAVDVLMRNCVRGTVNDALAPIRTRSATAGLDVGQKTYRNLSPLAAPGRE